MLSGEYTGIDKKTEFLCLKCNSLFISTPYNMFTKSFCPHCHTRAGGFKKYNSGYFYVLSFPDLSCIKYGITNNLNNRIRKHSKSNNCFLLFSLYFESGKSALDLENKIKKYVGGKYIVKEDMPDGFTETLHPTAINEILKLCYSQL